MDRGGARANSHSFRRRRQQQQQQQSKHYPKLSVYHGPKKDCKEMKEKGTGQTTRHDRNDCRNLLPSTGQQILAPYFSHYSFTAQCG